MAHRKYILVPLYALYEVTECIMDTYLSAYCFVKFFGSNSSA